jgi:hypothetical protein
MTTITCGGSAVEVTAEADDRGRTVYVPACCSARFPSTKVLQISHMNGCPRDREITTLLDREAGSS